MIITGNNKVITQIRLHNQERLGLKDIEGHYLLDKNDALLYSGPPNKIVAIYKGKDLIWLTTYQIDIRSCYGSGVWLDNYNWIDNDTWKN